MSMALIRLVRRGDMISILLFILGASAVYLLIYPEFSTPSEPRKTFSRITEPFLVSNNDERWYFAEQKVVWGLPDIRGSPFIWLV
jgi:hypothetical protein